MGNDEMMLRIHSTLHIVTNAPAASAARGHRTCIGIRQRDLLVLGLHHLSVQCVQALYLLPQRRNLVVEPRDLGLRYRFPLAIGAITRREVAGNALVDLLQAPLLLVLSKVPLPLIYLLHLATVDRD